MLKVVVVETDRNQRNMLKRVAQESNLELDFIAVYINGLPALEYLLTGQGDIFIANVDAPMVDGISIVKKLKEENIDVKTIFLSDNENFETVKEAAVLNPVAYILKPADEEEIKGALIKAIALCNKERAQKEEQEELRRKAENSLRAVRSQFVRDMLYQSSLDEEYIEQGSKNFDFDIFNFKKTVAVLKQTDIENSEISYSVLYAADIYISNDYKRAGYHFFPVVMSDNELAVLIASPDDADIEKEAKTLKDTLSERYGLNLFMGVSTSSNDILKLSKLYTQAKKAQEQALLIVEDESISPDFADGKNMTKSDIVVQKIKEIIKQQYSKKLTIEEIALKVNYSKKQAQRIFLKKTQKTIYEYLTEYRIERAKELLSAEKSKIYVSAEQVGYKNTLHFKKLFKKYTGMSPAEYKKQKKQERQKTE